MIIDVHAHLNDEVFDNTRQEIINSLAENNVEKVINAGCDFITCQKVLNLAENNKNCYCVLGVHPGHCEEYCEELENYIIQNATHNKVVAIGEIGLDYHYDNIDKELQKQVFIKQIKLAHKLGLPIVVHLRDAYGDGLEIFENYKQYLTNGVCLHCFSGSVEFYKQIQKFGFYVSIGGTLTFKNNVKTVQVAEILNRDKFMLETDCPYLSPEPFRGKINQPKNIQYVAQKFADIWHISPQEVIDKATQNSYNFFKKLTRE